MSVIPARQKDRSTIASMLAGSSHLVSYFLLAGAAADVLGYQELEPRGMLLPAILPLIVLAATGVIVSSRPAWLATVIQLVIGTGAIYGFALVLLGNEFVASARSVPPAAFAASAVPAASAADAGVLTFAQVAFILIVVSRRGVAQNLLWCALAYLGGEAATVFAAVRIGAVMRTDLVTTTILVGLLILLLFAMSRAPYPQARPRLDEAAIAEEISAIRYRVELKAAALLHDTVLNHLAAVATSSPGPLQPALRQQVRRDLDTLVGAAWLSDASPVLDDRARSDWDRSAISAAVDRAKHQKLTVDVTGDLAAVGRLSAERDEAVGLAVGQCLVNVLQHADVRHAELVIISSEHDVSVMVIDAGRGFSEAHIGADRLGIRQSVRSRIDAVGGGVRLWSTPGRGTSVMIRVPVGSSDG